MKTGQVVAANHTNRGVGYLIELYAAQKKLKRGLVITGFTEKRCTAAIFVEIFNA